MNINVLKSEMALYSVTIGELANRLSVSKSALYRKLSGKNEFSRLEISKIIKLLNLSESKVMLIFFDHDVSSETLNPKNAS